MSRSRVQGSPRYREERRKKGLRLGIVSAVALLSLAAAAILFLDAPYARISFIAVEGGDPATAQAVQGIIGSTIAGSYFGLIPRDSTLFFPEHSLSVAIARQFPALASVSVSRSGLSGAKAAIVPRVPAEVACAAPGDCYYADAGGVIFEPAPSSSGALPVYDIVLPPGADPIGVQFIDSGRLAGVAQFSSGLLNLGFSTESVALSTSTSGYAYDFVLRDLSADPGAVSDAATGDEAAASSSDASGIIHLIVDESRPFALTLQDFSAFWQEHLAATATDTAAKPLSLVDMRYGDNIIYETAPAAPTQ